LLNLGLFQIEAFTRTIKRLNAECNVAHLSQYVFSDTRSYKTKVSCPCGNNFTSKSIIFIIEVDVLLCEGFDFMQKAIDNGHKINRVCGKCNTLVQDEIDYGPHIIIDTTELTDNTYSTRNTKLRHSLESISKIVKVNGRAYLVSGLVSWSPGHYIAYTKSGTYWHEYNDIGPTRKSVNTNKIVQPHLILYTYSGTE